MQQAYREEDTDSSHHIQGIALNCEFSEKSTRSDAVLVRSAQIDEPRYRQYAGENTITSVTSGQDNVPDHP